MIPENIDIKSLPTLVEVVQKIKNDINKWQNAGCWTTNPSLSLLQYGAKWDLPGREFVNEADKDKFIVVRTVKKRHTLKPNLRYTPYLFRGQNCWYPHIVSSFHRADLPDKNGVVNEKVAREKRIVSNLKSEEFIGLLRSHPLFMLLDRGIVLPQERKPIFINMCCYGLAQHYGFNTAVIDFTTDIDVAAFFATTINKGDDVYDPVTDTTKNKVGVLYVTEIIPDITFKSPGGGFSTIGLQLYPRSGAQKGVLYNDIGAYIPVDEQVKPILFRHDANVSRHFYEKQKKGQSLFPADGISKYANEILHSKEISGDIFTENLYSNADNFEENMQSLHNQGYTVDWNRRSVFTEDMLNELAVDLQNGLWEQFCNQIYFNDLNIGDDLHESLLNLPKNPSYSYFFNMEEYHRIMDYDFYMQRRAKVNRRKHDI